MPRVEQLKPTGTADEGQLSASTDPAMTLCPLARTDWLTKRLSNHATDLLALLGRHKNWIETFGHDHGICKAVNRHRWVSDDPLRIVWRQAVAEPHAEVIQESDRVHG